MSAPYPNQSVLRSPLVETARQLRDRHQRPCRLAPLILMSDPERTPDIERLAAHLPEGNGFGAALIYRHFGDSNRHEIASRLREITSERQVQFLIGADPELARSVQADGVHFRRIDPVTDLWHWRDRHPDWIITQAALKDGAEQTPACPLDALFVSSVFSSRSPSAGTPIGLAGLNRICHAVTVPVIALGGLNDETAPRLIGTSVAGLAAIDGLATILRGETSSMTDNPIKAQTESQVTITRKETIRGLVFLADVDGESAQGELTLRHVRDGVYNANHTGVPSEIGGRGIGKRLVKAMVDDARKNGYTVIPGCPFVAKLFERQPELAEGVMADA